LKIYRALWQKPRALLWTKRPGPRDLHGAHGFIGAVLKVYLSFLYIDIGVCFRCIGLFGRYVGFFWQIFRALLRIKRPDTRDLNGANGYVGLFRDI